MISTYLGYQLYARNTQQSLDRVAAEPEVKSAQAYFDANIGKVKSVDDFVNNFRLFSYAMKAYGLSDLTYAKGLMKQVLTSDLTDSHSVANRFNDSRYRNFAQAFAFTTKGGVAQPPIQTSTQQSATVDLFQSKTSLTLDDKTSAAAVDYYKANIGSVKSVQALEKDKKLYSFVLTAYGLDATMPTATFESVVGSSLSDPKSLLNKTAGAGYAAIEGAINVSPAGGASTELLQAQGDDQLAATVAAYKTTVGTDTNSQTAAAAETSYYQATIANITTVGDLMKDSRLVGYIARAFALPSDASATTIKQVLTSDLSDPKSLVNALTTPGYKQMAQAFNFKTDGSLKTAPFQKASQQQDTISLYMARQTADTPAVTAATQYYRAHIGAVTSVSDLEKDTQLYKYVMSAYGISDTTSKATVEQVLESQPDASNGIVSTTAGSRYLTLNRAFSVDANGLPTDTLKAQSADAQAGTIAAYVAAAKTDTASQNAAARETTYYNTTMATVSSLDDFLGDSRLVAYVKQAFGLSAAGAATDHLQKVLTTGAKDVGKLSATDKKLWHAFSFTTTGLTSHAPVPQVQSDYDTATTDAGYLQQSMEDEAGQQSTGVQLALYFQRKAPTITSAYSILADKALLTVAQTVLGLSSNSAKADIDVQARYITSRLNLADLKDPTKLAKFIQRFAATYDAANPQTDNTIATLFGSASS